MKRMILSAAIAAFGLTLYTPALSLAGSTSAHLNSSNSECCVPCPTKHAVPEPGTIALLGAAIGAIYLKKRKEQE